MNLKGLRTKISAVFASLPTGLGALVAQFDPDTVMEVVQSHPVPLACYQALTLLATWYYRDEANAEQIQTEIEAPAAVVDEPCEVEQELKNEIIGEYER